MPTAKKNAVKARFAVVMGMQLLTLLLAVPFAALRQKILPEGNMAGMDANIALFGCVFVLYGGFNFIFFTKYYGNTDKVGVPFLLSSVWVFLWMAAAETCVFVVPFVRDKLDTADPQFLTEKLIVLLLGMLIYAAVTWAAYRISAEKFDKLDI